MALWRWLMSSESFISSLSLPPLLSGRNKDFPSRSPTTRRIHDGWMRIGQDRERERERPDWLHTKSCQPVLLILFDYHHDDGFDSSSSQSGQPGSYPSLDIPSCSLFPPFLHQQNAVCDNSQKRENIKYRNNNRGQKWENLCMNPADRLMRTEKRAPLPLLKFFSRANWNEGQNSECWWRRSQGMATIKHSIMISEWTPPACILGGWDPRIHSSRLLSIHSLPIKSSRGTFILITIQAWIE